MLNIASFCIVRSYSILPLAIDQVIKLIACMWCTVQAMDLMQHKLNLWSKRSFHLVVPQISYITYVSTVKCHHVVAILHFFSFGKIPRLGMIDYGLSKILHKVL